MEEQVRKQKASSIVAGGLFRFALYLCITIGMIYLGKTAYDFGYQIFNQEPMASEENGRDITIVLKKDDSVYQIGKILKKKGLIEDARIFVIQEMLSTYKGKMKPGTYILNTAMTADEMMEVMAQENLEGQPDENGTAKDGSSEIQDGSSTSPQEVEEPQEEGEGQ